MPRRGLHTLRTNRAITGSFFQKSPRHLYMMRVDEVSYSGNSLLLISLKARGHCSGSSHYGGDRSSDRLRAGIRVPR